MWANVPFDPSLLRSAAVADPLGLGRVINAAFEAGKLSRRGILCALNGLQAVSRHLTLPAVGKGSMEKIVEREIRRIMPAAQEDNFIYWQVLEGRGEVQKRVYVLSVPRGPLLSLLEALRAAKVRPAVMDLKPLALARAANRKDAVVANLESTSVDVVVVVDDIPAMIRSIHLGDTPQGVDLALSRLLDELSRTIGFYNDTNRANPLDPSVPILATGDLAADPAVAADISSLTGHPVVPLEPPLEYPPDFPVAQYMVNIGLVLKVL
jgi:Tfp pilus assembly PilM family ATPase